MGGRGASSGRKRSPTVRISMQFFGKGHSALKLPKKEYRKIDH